MVSRRIRLISLPARGWNWIFRFWGPNLAMAALVALVAFVFTGIWVRLAASLGFAGLYLAIIFVGGCVVAVFLNRDYVPNIQRLGSDIHFDLDPRPDGRFHIPAAGRCVVRDPNGVESSTERVPVGPQFWVAYPKDFPGAPAIVPGVYKATWIVEKPNGKWRVLLSKRYRENPPDQAASS